MADPNVLPYKAPVVATDEYSTTYENGVTLPRQGFAHEDALAFEQDGQPDIFAGIERYEPTPSMTGQSDQLAWDPPAQPAPSLAMDYRALIGPQAPAIGYRAPVATDAGVPIPTAAPVAARPSPAPVAAPVAPAPVAAPVAPRALVADAQAQVARRRALRTRINPITTPTAVEQAALLDEQGSTFTPVGNGAMEEAQRAGVNLAPADQAQYDRENQDQLTGANQYTPEGNIAYVAPPEGGAQAGTYGEITPQAAAAAGGRYGLTRDNTTTNVERGTPVDPAILQDLAYQAKQAQNANYARSQNAANQAQERSNVLAAEAQRMADRQSEMERVNAERTQAIRDQERTYAEATDAFAARTVDPARWYHDRGTGGTILAAIAMGLGAFGASLTGGKNTALDIIQSAIQDDIAAQKADLDTAHSSLAARNNLLGEMRLRFASEREAELAAEAALTRQAALRASAMEASHAAQNALPEGALTSAQLAIEADKLLAQLGQVGAERQTATTRTIRSVVGGRPGAAVAGAPGQAVDRRDRSGRLITGPGAGGRDPTEIPGAFVADHDRAMQIQPAVREQVANTVTNRNNFIRTMRQFRSLLERRTTVDAVGNTIASWMGIPTAQLREASTLLSDAVAYISPSRNAGVVNGSEYDRLAQNFPNPATLDLTNYKADTLDVALRSAESAFENSVRPYGYTLTAPRQERNTEGGAAPAAPRPSSFTEDSQ